MFSVGPSKDPRNIYSENRDLSTRKKTQIRQFAMDRRRVAIPWRLEGPIAVVPHPRRRPTGNTMKRPLMMNIPVTSRISPQNVPVACMTADPVATAVAETPINRMRPARLLKISTRPTASSPKFDHVLAGSTIQPQRVCSQNSSVFGANDDHGPFGQSTGITFR